jgi:hypothetical protein
MFLGVLGTLGRVDYGDLLRQCKCDIVSRCRYIDLEIWHGPWVSCAKKKIKGDCCNLSLRSLMSWFALVPVQERAAAVIADPLRHSPLHTRSKKTGVKLDD